MSSKNDESSALAMAVALVGAVFIAMAFLIAAFLAFLAFLFTVLSICAWNQPLTLGKLTIQPQEARAFVGRGLIGAVALPAFALFCAVLLGVPIDGEAWPYLLLGGYTVGSIGIEILMAQEADNAPPTITLPVQPVEPPKRVVLPPPSATPFRFASWDDEEDRK